MPERYIQHLRAITAQDAAVTAEKDEQYGSSWLNYGGLSAFFVTVRKWDRMIVQLKKVGMDVFRAYREDPREEGFADDVRDLRRYLGLWEAEAIEQGLVPVPPQPGPSLSVNVDVREALSVAGVLQDIVQERIRQDTQWGGAKHDDTHLIAEWAGFRRKFELRARHPGSRRESLVKIAALCVAEIESMDRTSNLIASKPACTGCGDQDWVWRKPGEGKNGEDICSNCLPRSAGTAVNLFDPAGQDHAEQR